MAAEHPNGEMNCGGSMTVNMNCGGSMTVNNLWRTSSEPIGEMKKPGKQTPFAPFGMSQQATKERLPVLISVPEGLDHHVDIPATGSLEVPTNNSGLQGVNHLVDIPVTASFEVTNNNSGPQDGNYANDCKLAAFGGLADCATGAAALVYNHPSSDEPVYLVGVGIVLAAGVAGILAALWVAYDVRKRGAAGRKIMYVSVFMLMLGIAVDIFGYTLKKRARTSRRLHDHLWQE